MPEELLEFENTVEDDAGKSWVAVVMGAERDDGKWIGWVRFDPADGGEPLSTDRETTQPNRPDLQYWATGLTYFYLEGALARARRKARKAAAPESPAAARAPAGPPDRGVPRVKVFSLDSEVTEEVMGVREPRPGTSRRVPDAGVVVYEGAVQDGEGSVHTFAVQCGTGTAASNMANWLWSRLHRAGVRAEVNGSHPETNADLRAALEPGG